MYAERSFGNIHLISRLANPNISEADADQMALIYLIENFREDNANIEKEIAENFQIFPPKNVIERFKEVRGNWENILDYIIKDIDRKRLEMQEKNKVLVDPKTYDIYSRALRNPGKRNQIEIYAPQLSDKDYQILGQEFGFLIGDRVVSGIGALRTGKRFMMFGAHIEKAGLYTRTPYSFIKTLSSKENRGSMREKRNKLQAIFERLNPQGSTLPTGELFVHVYDHSGNINPSLVGLAIETRLRTLGEDRKGVMYIVRNDAAEENYFYDPAKAK
jgi:hypothetical protein